MTLKVVMMPVSRIFNLHTDENVSRSGPLFKDEADRASAAACFCTERGYDLTIGPPLVVTPASEAEIATATVEGQTLLEEIRESKADRSVRVQDASYKVSPNDLRVAHEAQYLKGTKLIVGSHLTISGNRRNANWALVNAVRAQMGLDPITEIPVTIKTYATKMDRYVDIIMANTRMMDGVRKLGNADVIQAAYRLFSEQAKEVDFRKVWKVGTAQKLFAICKINLLLPVIGLVEGLLTDAIPFGAIDKEMARKYVKAIEDGDVPDAVEVAIVVAAISKSGGGNKKKIASRDDIESALQCPILPFQIAVKAVLENDLGRLNAFVAMADELNAAWAGVTSSQPKPTAGKSG